MDKPILYTSATCHACLEVSDFINASNLDVEARWVLPRMDLSTATRYHIIVSSGLRVDQLAGVPTLVDGDQVIQSSTAIINHLKNKYKAI